MKNWEKNRQRISRIRSFINQYEWKEIILSTWSKIWEKKIIPNNQTSALNILILPHNRRKITSVHLKTQFRTWKSIVLLKITDGEKWHHFGVKSLPALLQGITSTNNGNYFCISCLHQSKLQSLQKVCGIITIVTTISKTRNKILNLIRNKNQKDSFTTRKHKTIPVATRKKL